MSRTDNLRKVMMTEGCGAYPVEQPKAEVIRMRTEFKEPPGKMGELYRYYYGMAVKQIPEVALVSAIGTVAGVVGRNYNVLGDVGLNINIMLLAKSGRGKGQMSRSPFTFFNYVAKDMKLPDEAPNHPMNFISKEKAVHGNALYMMLSERESFTVFNPEFGKTFRQMMTGKPSDPLVTVRDAIVDVYDQSGKYGVVGKLRYTDSKKTVTINRPVSMSYIGESVKEPFFDSLNVDAFSDGIMSRFVVMQYEGVIPYDNTNRVLTPEPSLVKHFSGMIETVGSMLGDYPVRVATVGISDDLRLEALGYTRYCTDMANACERAGDVVREATWTRANLTVFKAAGLLAVADNPNEPVITREHWEWAKWFYTQHQTCISSAFTSGDIAEDEATKSENIVREMIDKYYTGEPLRIGTAYSKDDVVILRAKGLMPFAALCGMSKYRTSFKGDSEAKKRKLLSILDMLCKCGELEYVDLKHPTEKELYKDLNLSEKQSYWRMTKGFKK